jgi:hypothetical protein
MKTSGLLFLNYYSGLFLHNPLGLGLNYIEEFTIKRPETGDSLPPHETLSWVLGFLEESVLFLAYFSLREGSFKRKRP